MKFENWKGGAELVGIVAIVASLVFVGIQLKQSQDIAASQIYQERTNASVAAAIAIAQNKDIISAMVKGASNDFESITSAEKTATVIAISGYAMLWDNAYYQYEQGYLSSDGWERIRNDIKIGLRGPVVGRVIKVLVENGQVRPALADVFGEIFLELDAEKNK